MSTGAAVAPAAPVAPTNGAAKSAPQTPAGNAPPPATSDGKQPAQAAPKPPAPEQPWKAKRKLVINGKEVEKEYTDRDLQILEHERSQRAETLRQRAEFEARMRKLTEDPDAFFQESGIDVEAILAARQQRAEAMKQMTPQEKRIAELEAQIQKTAKAEEQRMVREKQAQAEHEHHTLVQQNVQTLAKAIEVSGQPRSGALLRELALVQELALRNGEPPMTPEQLAHHGERLQVQRVAELLKASKSDAWRARNAPLLKEVAQAVLPELEGDALLDWVGEAHAKRIVAASYAKLRRSPTPIVQEPPGQQQAPPPNTKPDGMTWDEAADKFGF